LPRDTRAKKKSRVWSSWIDQKLQSVDKVNRTCNFSTTLAVTGLVQSALERCEEAQGGEPDVLVRTGTRAELSHRYGSKTLATNSNLRNPFHDTFRAPGNIFDQPNDT
jgi:hypothetical protein